MRRAMCSGDHNNFVVCGHGERIAFSHTSMLLRVCIFYAAIWQVAHTIQCSPRPDNDRCPFEFHVNCYLLKSDKITVANDTF